MLTFTSLFLKNWKGYIGEHKVELDRPPGLYYVRGENFADAESFASNGAGKSSLWDALAWALYGKTLRDERPGASIEPWSGEKPTRVALAFRRDASYYRVERGRHPNTLMLQTNGGEPESCDQPRIDEVVGLSYTAFCCTIVLRQAADSFLDLRAEEQSQLIAEALTLDLWIDASETAGALSREIKAELEETRTIISQENGRIPEIMAQLRRERKLEQDWDKETAQAHAAVLKQLRDYETQTIKLKKELEKIPESAEIPAIQHLIELLTGDVVELATKQRTAAADVRRCDETIAELQRQSYAYEKLKVCPECKQPVDVAHRREKQTELRDKAKHAQAEGTKLKKLARETASALEQKQAELENARRKLAEAQARYEGYAKQKHALETKVELASRESARLRLEDKRFTKAVNPYTAVLGELAERNRRAQEALAAAKAKLADLEWSQAAYDYWQGAFKQIRLDLIDECLSGLTGIANQAMEQLDLIGWRVELVTERETAQGKLSRKLAVMLYPPGADTPVRYESYCGRETSALQLALRFALSEVLLETSGVAPSLEILDEPSRSVSPPGVEELMRLLRERAHRLQRQIFVVEHHILDESLFDGVLNVAKDATGSHVSWDDIGAPLKAWDPRDEPWLRQEDALCS